MVVALIGCDCSGKSTCFDKMDKSIGTFIKGTQIKGIGVQYLLDLEQQVLSDDLYIFDRIPIIDDFVYYPIFNKGTMSNLFWMLDEVEKIVRQCTFIYFKCTPGEIAKRMNKRGDEFVDESNIEPILVNYSATFELLNIHPTIISTNLLNEEQTFKEVMEVIEKCKSRRSYR